MSDKQQTVLLWIARAISVLMGIAGVLAAAEYLPVEVQHFSTLAVAVLAMVYGKILSWLPPPPKMKLPPGGTAGVVAVLALAVGLMLSAGCKSTLPTRTTAGLMRATVTTSNALAATTSANHVDCLKMGRGTEAYQTCIAADLKRLVSYRDNIRPAARSAVAAAYAAIMIAREAGKDDLDYMAILKPGACAIILGLREWGHKLPNHGGGILPLLDGFSPLACEAPKNAIGVITALLPVAVDLVKWIVGLVGADASALEREIYVWITGSPIDEVDAMIITVGAALPVPR